MTIQFGSWRHEESTDLSEEREVTRIEHFAVHKYTRQRVALNHSGYNEMSVYAFAAHVILHFPDPPREIETWRSHDIIMALAEHVRHLHLALGWLDDVGSLVTTGPDRGNVYLPVKKTFVEVPADFAAALRVGMSGVPQ